MANKECPRCSSTDTRRVNYRGTNALVCSSCGHDETTLLDQLPDERSAPKKRGPYRIGGSRRSQKLADPRNK